MLWIFFFTKYFCPKFFRQQFCGFLVKVGCVSIQAQILDLIHSYLSNSVMFAKWHEILFGKAIRSSDILRRYLASCKIDDANVPLQHKQMLLVFINNNTADGSVLSDVVKKVLYGRCSVSIFHCLVQIIIYCLNNWNKVRFLRYRAMKGFCIWTFRQGQLNIGFHSRLGLKLFSAKNKSTRFKSKRKWILLIFQRLERF